MRYILAIFLVYITFNSFAQQISYKQWQELAKNEINLQPEYGNVKKDQGHIDEDEKFKKQVLEADGTLTKGSEHLISLGFKYLYSGDLQTAMRRFNQAWLLNPKNENAYWAYGAVYSTLGNDDEALRQYEKGLAINPSSSNILTDKATINFMAYQRNNDKSKLNIALNLLNQSYKIDPKNQNTTFKLSVCYFLNNDCANAVKYYNECKALGGQPITQGYTDALKKSCNN
jgi:tetratricopeptide (TPR) repeat protein